MNHKKLLLCVVIKYMFFVCGDAVAAEGQFDLSMSTIGLDGVPTGLSESMTRSQLNLGESGTLENWDLSSISILDGKIIPNNITDRFMLSDSFSLANEKDQFNPLQIFDMIANIQHSIAMYCKNLNFLDITEKQTRYLEINQLIQNLKTTISQDPTNTNKRIQILNEIALNENSTQEHIQRLALNIKQIEFITKRKEEASADALETSSMFFHELVSNGEIWPDDIPDRISYIKQLPIHDTFKIYFLQLMWVSIVGKLPDQNCERNLRTPALLTVNRPFDSQVINRALRELCGRLPSVFVQKDGSSKFSFVIAVNKKISIASDNNIPVLDESKQSALIQFWNTVKEWRTYCKAIMLPPTLKHQRVYDENKLYNLYNQKELLEERLANEERFFVCSTAQKKELDDKDEKYRLAHIKETVKRISRINNHIQKLCDNGIPFEVSAYIKYLENKLNSLRKYKEELQRKGIKFSLLNEEDLIAIEIEHLTKEPMLKALDAYANAYKVEFSTTITKKGYIDALYSLALFVHQTNKEIPELNNRKHVYFLNNIQAYLNSNEEDQIKVEEICNIFRKIPYYQKRFEKVITKNDALRVANLLNDISAILDSNGMLEYVKHLSVLTWFVMESKNKNLPSIITEVLTNEKHILFLEQIEQIVSSDESYVKLYRDLVTNCYYLNYYTYKNFIIVTPEIKEKREQIRDEIVSGNFSRHHMLQRIKEVYPRPEADAKEREEQIKAYNALIDKDAFKIYNKHYLTAYVGSKIAKVQEKQSDYSHDTEAIVFPIVEEIIKRNFIFSDPKKGWLSTIKRSFAWFFSCLPFL